MSETGALRIVVPARAENVAVLRRAVSGLGDALGVEPSDLGDLQTIVTEAAMNVVQHAYEDSEGPLELVASPKRGGLELAICDHGDGFRPRPADPGFESDAPAGVVLSHVIGVLASRADLSIDRLADSQLLGDAVSATPAREFAGGRIEISITDREGCLELRIGPLVSGAAERLLKEMELPGPLKGSLSALASDVKVESAADGAERVLIEVSDPR
jgi:anti-sigma regulatory factor (Ser/Thr protein kinase)